MNNTNTGGPAFPGKQKALAIKTEHIGIASEYEIEQNGMTLRDYFAAKVLQAYLADPAFSNVPQGEVARLAYDMADSMLKARVA